SSPAYGVTPLTDRVNLSRVYKRATVEVAKTEFLKCFVMEVGAVSLVSLEAIERKTTCKTGHVAVTCNFCSNGRKHDRRYESVSLYNRFLLVCCGGFEGSIKPYFSFFGFGHEFAYPSV